MAGQHNQQQEEEEEEEEEEGEEEEEDEEEEEEAVDDDSDPGTSWFSEHKAPEKVVEFLTRPSFPLAPCHHHHHHHHHRGNGNNKEGGNGNKEGPGPLDILDLGTGNGSMLALLRNRGGFTDANMVGVDYSWASVELARQLQRLRLHSAYQYDGDHEDKDIRFEEWDILDPRSAAQLNMIHEEDDNMAQEDDPLDWFPYDKGGFDLVLDKGTFDAVSLSGDSMASCERYPTIARKLVKKGGFLLVTSCNWTEEELLRWFTTNNSDGDDGLVVWGRVDDYPTFTFGGRSGQGVCTVCFQRR